MSRRAAPPNLVAFSTGAARGPGEVAALARAVAQGAEGGLEALVLREPLLPDGPFLELARRCRPLVAWLALHDRPHLAAAAGADAVHLGFRSLTPAEARRVVGDALALGLSSHATDEPAAWRDADYLTFGPVFETPSKAGILAPTGLAALAARCAAAAPRPVLALGGVTAERAAACVAQGAHGVAAIGDLLGHAAPAARARAFRAALAHGEARP